MGKGSFILIATVATVALLAPVLGYSRPPPPPPPRPSQGEHSCGCNMKKPPRYPQYPPRPPHHPHETEEETVEEYRCRACPGYEYEYENDGPNPRDAPEACLRDPYCEEKACAKIAIMRNPLDISANLTTLCKTLPAAIGDTVNGLEIQPLCIDLTLDPANCIEATGGAEFAPRFIVSLEKCQLRITAARLEDSGLLRCVQVLVCAVGDLLKPLLGTDKKPGTGGLLDGLG